MKILNIIVISTLLTLIIYNATNKTKATEKKKVTEKPTVTNGRAYQIDFKIDTLPPYGLRDSLIIYDGDRLVGTIPFSEDKGVAIDSLLMADNE